MRLRHLLAAVIVSISAATPARADPSCNALLARVFKWAAHPDQYVDISVGTMRGDGLQSRVQGLQMTYYAHTPPALYSRVPSHQIFSDRYVAGTVQPFDIGNTNDVSLLVDATGNVSFWLETLGGVQVDLVSPICANDILYGFSNEAVPALWAITFVLGVTPG
jgi:hypothetical protein